MGTTKKFTIVVKKKGDEFKATCKQVPGVYTLGRDKEDTLKRFKIAIFRKLKLGAGPGGSGSGTSTASRPVPVKPSPTHHLTAAKHLPPSDETDSFPKD
jgi:hypothetical protein